MPEVSIVVASDVDVDDDDDDNTTNPSTVPVPPPRTVDTNAAFAFLNDDDDDDNVEGTTAKPCAFTANINSNATENTANFMIIILSCYFLSFSNVSLVSIYLMRKTNRSRVVFMELCSLFIVYCTVL